jgi:TatA/E family protein of Tat protein translocase
MGQLGFQEIVMIFVVALLVFGPKKLPELGKSLGKGIREFKKATDELKSSWEDQVKDISAPLNDVKRDIHSMGQNLKSDLYKHLEAEQPLPATPALPPAPMVVEAHEIHETHEALELHEMPEAPHAAQIPAETTTPKEHV